MVLAKVRKVAEGVCVGRVVVYLLPRNAPFLLSFLALGSAEGTRDTPLTKDISKFLIFVMMMVAIFGRCRA